MNLINPLCLALDVDTPHQALEIAKELGGKIGVIKVGPRLTNLDSSIVKKLSEFAPVFVDHKYYDIPSTMEAAVRSAFAAGASFVTIHASCGTTALELMSKVEKELNQQRPFKILAVTVLTSFSVADLPEFTKSTPIVEQVKSLAALAVSKGVTGIVCSPQETALIRAQCPSAFIVTPGIRSSKGEKGDQSRTLSASEAIRAGANLLVVGRPIIQSANPSSAVSEIIKELL
jgi:orotidine-5'-phosphate decarboxylase